MKIPIFLLSNLLAVQPSVLARESDLYTEELSLQRFHGESLLDRVSVGRGSGATGYFDIGTAVSYTHTVKKGDKVVPNNSDSMIPPIEIFLNILRRQSQSQSR